MLYTTYSMPTARNTLTQKPQKLFLYWQVTLFLLPKTTSHLVEGLKFKMKSDIHPQYFPQAQVICACGNRFTIGSTKEQIHVELCYNCHPFYTGQQKFVDTIGNIEKFQSKQKVAVAKQAVVKQKKVQAEEEDRRPKTLREMLQQAK